MKREAGVIPARTRHRDSRFMHGNLHIKAIYVADFMWKMLYQRFNILFRSAGRPACRCTWDTQATRNWLYEDVVCCRTQQIGFFYAFLSSCFGTGFLYHRKLLSYDIKTLRYGCDRCADELCKLKLARIGAQRVASDSLLIGESSPAFVIIYLHGGLL